MIKTKQEYIDGLRRALTGRIGVNELEGHIRYYEDYITVEGRLRGSEEAVIESLGDPKLIAMSICAAEEAADAKESGVHYSEGVFEEHARRGDGGDDSRPFFLKHPRIVFWAIIALVIALVILLAVVAFWLLKILWPFILILIIAVIVARLIIFLGYK